MTTNHQELSRPGPGRFVTVDRILRGLVRHGPVLELGCGDGRVIQMLGEEGHHTVGIDIALRPLRRAQRRGLRRLVRADGQRLPFPRQAFAAVVSGFFAANLMDRERMVAEASRVLAPGGILVYTLLNPWTRIPDVVQHRLRHGHGVDPRWIARYARRLGDPGAEPERLRRHGLTPNPLMGAAWLPVLRRSAWLQSRTPVVSGPLWRLAWDVVVSGRKLA